MDIAVAITEGLQTYIKFFSTVVKVLSSVGLAIENARLPLFQVIKKEFLESMLQELVDNTVVTSGRGEIFV